ncbi:MAG: 4-(cytidine 5'-diphospho)-2-C-methyl-D-erythritol kinase [Deltaproteobacteria bacterium]|nr:4-(cytidine 5'-diphospho)-2-C-methyl-D-erythritol kinase [Deltaproteobacteria bacterium]
MPSQQISVSAYTKINLGLEIVGKRANGYHDILTVFQKISLHDQIIINRQRSDITISSSDLSLPCDHSNLCYKAAKKFLERFAINGGVNIHIEKHIPIAGGVGGGSADAAAVLKILPQMFKLEAEQSFILELAVSIGADVSFLATEYITAIGEGIGDRLREISSPKSKPLLIISPSIDYFPGQSKTPFLYRTYDGMLKDGKIATARMDIASVQMALERSDFSALKELATNAFEPVAFSHYPVLNEIKQRLYSCGAEFSLLAGAGPCVFGLFRSEEEAKRAGEDLSGFGRIILAKTLGGNVS